MLTKTHSLFDDKITIGVPEGFAELNDQETSLYYKNERPNIVFANKEKGAILTLSILEQPLKSSEVEARVQEYVVLYQRSIPNFANCKVAMRPIDENNNIGIFCYTSTTTEKNLLNYVVIACVDGKETLITMHCDINDCPLYAEKFMKSINSICINN